MGSRAQSYNFYENCSSQNTITWNNKNYNFFAYCGQTYDRYGPSGGCDLACPVKSWLLCGGKTSISVFKINHIRTYVVNKPTETPYPAIHFYKLISSVTNYFELIILSKNRIYLPKKVSFFASMYLFSIFFIRHNIFNKFLFLFFIIYLIY